MKHDVWVCSKFHADYAYDRRQPTPTCASQFRSGAPRLKCSSPTANPKSAPSNNRFPLSPANQNGAHDGVQVARKPFTNSTRFYNSLSSKATMNISAPSSRLKLLESANSGIHAPHVEVKAAGLGWAPAVRCRINAVQGSVASTSL